MVRITYERLSLVALKGRMLHKELKCFLKQGGPLHIFYRILGQRLRHRQRQRRVLARGLYIGKDSAGRYSIIDATGSRGIDDRTRNAASSGIKRYPGNIRSHSTNEVAHAKGTVGLTA